MKRRIGMVMGTLAFAICMVLAAGLDNGKSTQSGIRDLRNSDAGADRAESAGTKAHDGDSGANEYDAEEDFLHAAWVYEDVMAAADEYDLFEGKWRVPYADDETFSVIRNAYAKIDFNGEFCSGEPEVYEEYRQKFWELMQGEGMILNRETGEECTIFEFLEESFSGDGEKYAPENHEYTYYLYDLNGDGCPELGIREGRFLTYFLRYDKEADLYCVWYRMEGYRPLGVRKGMYTFMNRLTYSFGEGAFLLLDENADMECCAYFFSKESSEETLHMVMLPIYADKGQEAEVTREMKEQGVYIRSAGCIQSLGNPVSLERDAMCFGGQWFFRVTGEQFDELIDSYLAAYRKWNQEKCEAQYFYEELFGDFIQEASKTETPGDQGRMTQREALEVLLYELYQDTEIVMEEDPPIYNFQLVWDDPFYNPLDSGSLLCLVYEGSSPDGSNYLFTLLDQLYDDLEDRYEEKYYRSAYLNGFAVNRETGEVFAEREWDDDACMWEYGEEYLRIADMGREDEQH